MTRKYKKQRQGVIVMTCLISIFTLTKEAVRVDIKQQNQKTKNQEYKKRQKIKTKKKLRVNAIVACVCFNVSALRKKLEGDNKLKEFKKHKNKKIEKLEGGVENQLKRKRSILSLWHVFILLFMF